MVITKPGVQKPHWSPWHSRSADWTGDSSPSGDAMPSTVVTSLPSACTANMRHERTAAPSTRTVHAPHTPCSQPRWVPVRWQRSRRKSASVSRGSTVSLRSRSEEHTSELQSLMRISYAVFCLKKKHTNKSNKMTVKQNKHKQSYI